MAIVIEQKGERVAQGKRPRFLTQTRNADVKGPSSPRMMAGSSFEGPEKPPNSKLQAYEQSEWPSLMKMIDADVYQLGDRVRISRKKKLHPRLRRGKRIENLL